MSLLSTGFFCTPLGCVLEGTKVGMDGWYSGRAFSFGSRQAAAMDVHLYLLGAKDRLQLWAFAYVG